MTQMQLYGQSAKPWKPHAYQKKALKFLLEHACSALFLDPGLGKTSIALAAIKFLLHGGMLNKVLIIAPLRVCHGVWPEELELWTDFHCLKMEVLHGPDKAAALEREADIYVINPEGLEWLLQTKKTRSPKTGKCSVEVNIKRFKALGFDTLIIDELSKFKHTQTIRFKALKPVLHTFNRRWGLTGSPVANGLLDLFGQCYVLDLGNALGRYITHYRNEYFNPTGYDGYTWVPQKGADKRIYKRLAPLVLRMAAEDYIKMPKIIEQNVFVELSKKAYRIYDELEKDLFTQIEDKDVSAANTAVASGKCRQVASGALYLDPMDNEEHIQKFKGKKEWVDIHSQKLDAIEELVGELQGSPLLIAYDFKHDLARLLKRLGKATPYIGGGVSIKKSKAIEAAWNAGGLPVLLGHPQSIAHGLNLQKGDAHHVCWFSLTWNYEHYDQFIRRVRRQGNKALRVFVYHLLARGTVDEAVLLSLQHKEGGQTALFNALKKYQKKKRGY